MKIGRALRELVPSIFPDAFDGKEVEPEMEWVRCSVFVVVFRTEVDDDDDAGLDGHHGLLVYRWPARRAASGRERQACFGTVCLCGVPGAWYA